MKKIRYIIILMLLVPVLVMAQYTGGNGRGDTKNYCEGNTKPTVSITTPAEGDVLNSNPVTISGTSSDSENNISLVEVRINGGTWQTATGTTSWTIDLDLASGMNTIEARAQDTPALYSDIDEIEVILTIQFITIPQGWSYVSSWINPADPNIVNLWADIVGANNLAILTGVQGIYAPAPYYINTLGNWDVLKGFKVKMNAEDELIVRGDTLADKNVNFAAGVHLIPVLTNHTVQLDEVFNDPLNDILYMLDLYHNKVYWPNGNVFSLSELEPGEGYLANFKNPVTISYPLLDNFTVDSHQNLPPAPGPWPCVRTADFHLISVSAQALQAIGNTDYIGAFNSQGNCVGYTKVEKTGENMLLTIYGDDVLTSEADGMVENGLIRFRCYNSIDNTEKELSATFNPTFPNVDGLFYISGLSGITGFKETATGVGENDLAARVQVYPNPATDELSINLTKPGAWLGFSATLITAEGKMVKTFEINNEITKLDVTNLQPGIYILKIESTNSVVLKRVVIQ